MAAITFLQSIVVPHEAIDNLGHVNNVYYLNWIQDISVAHWEATVSAEQHRKLCWVALQHVIDYKAAAFEGDELLLTTWIDASTGVRSVRRVDITRQSDQKLIVSAKTSWCLVDADTHRPKRIPQEIIDLFNTKR